MDGDRVLVLDCQGPNGLALCRTLGRKGLSVTAGGARRRLPGMLSAHTDDSYVHPHPGADRDAFVADLHSELERGGYAAVFPVTDRTTAICAEHRERLSDTGTAVGAERYETYSRANDKWELAKLAEAADVPHPETRAPETLEAVAAIDGDREGTVVIKPRRTTTVTADGESHTNRLGDANYVAPDEDLRARYESFLEGDAGLRAEYPLVQSYLDGVGTMATVGLADEGELLAVFQHDKDRVYPPSGGIGAVRTGIVEPTMRRYTERVVRELAWTGPIHVEFMKLPDGDFSLVEVNGRYWGSLALTINSGVDVPWLHYQLLTGEPPAPRRPEGYRTDVRQRKLFYQDLRWLGEQLSRRRIGALVPFLGSFATTRDEFLAPEDPLPALGLVPRTMMALSDRRRNRSGDR